MDNIMKIFQSYMNEAQLKKPAWKKKITMLKRAG